MHANAHGGVRTHARESALKVESGRKIPCCARKSNLRQRRDSPVLYKSATSPPIFSLITSSDCSALGIFLCLPTRLKWNEKGYYLQFKDLRTVFQSTELYYSMSHKTHHVLHLLTVAQFLTRFPCRQAHFPKRRSSQWPATECVQSEVHGNTSKLRLLQAPTDMSTDILFLLSQWKCTCHVSWFQNNWAKTVETAIKMQTCIHQKGHCNMLWMICKYIVDHSTSVRCSYVHTCIHLQIHLAKPCFHAKKKSSFCCC